MSPFLEASDNNQEIFCQALTPATEVLNRTGRSQSVILNVYRELIDPTYYSRYYCLYCVKYFQLKILPVLCTDTATGILRAFKNFIIAAS